MLKSKSNISAINFCVNTDIFIDFFANTGCPKKICPRFNKKALGSPSKNSHERKKVLGGPSEFFWASFFRTPCSLQTNVFLAFIDFFRERFASK
jgi:hypothetical protein